MGDFFVLIMTEYFDGVVDDEQSVIAVSPIKEKILERFKKEILEDFNSFNDDSNYTLDEIKEMSDNEDSDFDYLELNDGYYCRMDNNKGIKLTISTAPMI